jgi:hypothetical protein
MPPRKLSPRTGDLIVRRNRPLVLPSTVALPGFWFPPVEASLVWIPTGLEALPRRLNRRRSIDDSDCEYLYEMNEII